MTYNNLFSIFLHSLNIPIIFSTLDVHKIKHIIYVANFNLDRYLHLVMMILHELREHNHILINMPVVITYRNIKEDQ